MTSKSNLVYFSQIETSTKLNAALLVSWLCDYRERRKTEKVDFMNYSYKKYFWHIKAGLGCSSTPMCASNDIHNSILCYI